MPDARGALRRVLGVQRELLTTEEVARDYKFPSREAARKFLSRYGRHLVQHRGRIVLIDKRDMDALMDEHRRAA